MILIRPIRFSSKNHPPARSLDYFCVEKDISISTQIINWIMIRKQKLWDKARPLYKDIMERHVCLPIVVVEEGCSNGGGEPSALDMHKKVVNDFVCQITDRD
jgi:hypothetical protein